MWKIVEGLIPNLSDPITCYLSARRGRTGVACHSGAGRLGTLKYNSFRWRSIRIFKQIAKSYSYAYRRNIVHLPCRPGFNNSLDGGDFLHGGHYADDMAVN